jgi:hypothetical protein
LSEAFETYTKKKRDFPAVIIVYSKEEYGLKDAYRLLAKKVLEVKQCRQRYTSE